MIPQVLTIAGSDSGGGAGIQADIKTFQELGVYSTSVLTAVTAQNTLGVAAIYPMAREAVQTQLQAVGKDFQLASLKTGMLFNEEIIEETAKWIRHFNWRQLVVDPVMIAKGGANLLRAEAGAALKKELLPLAAVVTPNVPEAEVLSGIEIIDSASRKLAAQKILSYGPESVIIKGGHGKDENVAEDFFLGQDGEEMLFRSPRIATVQTHGTGCTFSAALTAELAKGKSLKDAVYTAKQFIHAALSSELNIGAGHGPTNHAAYRKYMNERREMNYVEIQ
ncbi:bifunctional hydroxymethylpyrimidine kinase/phosphomethylpyrimidine kinase [Planococcus sp. NCCP-2050]|uniref:bifunctional hydroxymethylpyrimidine kinase/phosphomethylpyrimidine kinase n=1 Tax=Planococcus sp. NCCP-2050 TaxID=2944679 RepID=UPI00203FA3F0|nr:bifunctional hydroxymethylpyrimidine kinase/phosphomethylpyrimidine kinase [Planococcus sp. NCCP-2050]GKW45777.1 hydroxymethylpyrimidine/phosphomethylpyrimidine kinase [Planococcus sp. NCCP-2050]